MLGSGPEPPGLLGCLCVRVASQRAVMELWVLGCAGSWPRGGFSDLFLREGEGHVSCACPGPPGEGLLARRGVARVMVLSVDMLCFFPADWLLLRFVCLGDSSPMSLL